MRVHRAAALCAAIAAGGVSLATLTAATGGGAATVSGNRGSAVQDARRLLARLVVPVGARRLARAPAGAGVIANPFPRPATPDITDVYAWWRVPGSPASVLTYIVSHTRHPTQGLPGSGSGAGPSWSSVQLEFPPVPGVLDSRLLVVKVVGLSHGVTAVRADGEVVWVIPRPASEQIPAGVHEVDVTRGRSGQLLAVSVTVTDPARVATIVSLIDALPTVQPYTMSCPSFGLSPVVTFTFRAKRHGPIVAQASQLASATEPTTGCDAMSFSIRGRPQTPLLGGARVVRTVQRLVGVQLALSP
jgi:hypothetical protein